VDLERISGLPMELGDAGQVVFGPDVVVDEFKARLLDELADVALEPGACRGSQEVAYYMYNGVYRSGDAALLDGVPMRYELTLIPPRRIGREFVKTFGHRHCPEPGSGMDYAEICEVLVGTAHFLFQTLDASGPDASFALCVEATAGQKVLLPPGFDHCTINSGPEPLLFSDVIALGASGIYDRFRATRGAVYLEVAEDGRPQFMANPTYRDVPPLEWIEPKDYPDLHLTTDEPLFTVFLREKGASWPFLIDPRRFWPAFPDLEAVFRPDAHMVSSQ
jgi:glucose-6-phosphate isomerase